MFFANWKTTSRLKWGQIKSHPHYTLGGLTRVTIATIASALFVITGPYCEVVCLAAWQSQCIWDICAHSYSWNIFQRSKRNFVSARGHVISSLWFLTFLAHYACLEMVWWSQWSVVQLQRKQQHNNWCSLQEWRIWSQVRSSTHLVSLWNTVSLCPNFQICYFE